MRTIFIDNGVTGTIGCVGDGIARFVPTPTIKMQDYTKSKSNITRIDAIELSRLLSEMAIDQDTGKAVAMAFLERPLVNPARFKATISAVRALEATITVIEQLRIPYAFVDSKEWQRGLLPSSGKKGADSATLKQESRDIGTRLFPQFREEIARHRDADGILGAYRLSMKCKGDEAYEGTD